MSFTSTNSTAPALPVAPLPPVRGAQSAKPKVLPVIPTGTLDDFTDFQAGQGAGAVKIDRSLEIDSALIKRRETTFRTLKPTGEDTYSSTREVNVDGKPTVAQLRVTLATPRQTGIEDVDGGQQVTCALGAFENLVSGDFAAVNFVATIPADVTGDFEVPVTFTVKALLNDGNEIVLEESVTLNITAEEVEAFGGVSNAINAALADQVYGGAVDKLEGKFAQASADVSTPPTYWESENGKCFFRDPVSQEVKEFGSRKEVMAWLADEAKSNPQYAPYLKAIFDNGKVFGFQAFNVGLRSADNAFTVEGEDGPVSMRSVQRDGVVFVLTEAEYLEMYALEFTEPVDFTEDAEFDRQLTKKVADVLAQAESLTTEAFADLVADTFTETEIWILSLDSEIHNCAPEKASVDATDKLVAAVKTVESKIEASRNAQRLMLAGLVASAGIIDTNTAIREATGGPTLLDSAADAAIDSVSNGLYATGAEVVNLTGSAGSVVLSGLESLVSVIPNSVVVGAGAGAATGNPYVFALAAVIASQVRGVSAQVSPAFGGAQQPLNCVPGVQTNEFNQMCNFASANLDGFPDTLRANFLNNGHAALLTALGQLGISPANVTAVYPAPETASPTNATIWRDRYVVTAMGANALSLGVACPSEMATYTQPVPPWFNQTCTFFTPAPPTTAVASSTAQSTAGSSSLTGSTAGSGVPPTGVSTGPQTATPPPPSGSESEGSNPADNGPSLGLIIGAVAGGVAGLGGLITICICCLRGGSDGADTSSTEDPSDAEAREATRLDDLAAARRREADEEAHLLRDRDELLADFDARPYQAETPDGVTLDLTEIFQLAYLHDIQPTTLFVALPVGEGGAETSKAEILLTLSSTLR